MDRRERGRAYGYHAVSPQLLGLPTTADVAKSADTDTPYSIWLNVGQACDLRCPRCFNDNPGDELPSAGELSVGELVSVTRSASEMGVRSVVIPGRGEPFHPANLPATWSICTAADELQMNVAVFSHGGFLTSETLERFASMSSSMLLKYDSVTPAIQDSMAGRRGYTARREQALALLLASELCKSDEPRMTRLGLVTSITRFNYQGIPEIHRVARHLHAYPDFDVVLPIGRGKNARQGLPSRLVHDTLTQLQKMDAEEFRLYWDLVPTDASFSCSRPLYNLHIGADGTATPCVGTQDISLGSVRRTALSTLWNSGAARNVRQYARRITGRCASCVWRAEGLCRPCLARCLSKRGRRNLTTSEAVATTGCWMYRRS